MRYVIVLIALFIFNQSATSQKVGINEANPNASLDINGDVIFQRDVLSLQNGQNDNVDITTNKFSFYEITGVTNAFQISGFNGGIDGKILIIHNPTAHAMTLQHQHGGSLLSNQIFIGASGDITFGKGESVILGFTSSNSRWVILSRFAQGGCPPGMANCGGSCVSLNLDSQHCGNCSTVCPNGTQCYNGVCTLFGCPVGFGNCNNDISDGCEINLLTNSNHCGTCSNVCNFPNSTSTCLNGVCVLTCNTGFADCNGLTSDGCEINLQTSVNNCGACGIACSAANGTAACTNGICTIAFCNSGYSNCNGLTSDGCEVNLQTSVNNCGACGNACSIANGIAACTNGICTIAFCNSGYSNCNGLTSDGCEVNLQTSVNNCGACGIVCSLPNATSACVGGSCQILTCNSGFSNCNGITSDGCECNLLCVNGNCQ